MTGNTLSLLVWCLFHHSIEYLWFHCIALSVVIRTRRVSREAMSRLPTGASLRRPMTPWFWFLAQPKAFEPFRAGERQGGGNTHLQTIDVAFGGESDPERGGQEVHGQPFALSETSGNNAGQVSTNTDTCLFYERILCVWCSAV